MTSTCRFVWLIQVPSGLSTYVRRFPDIMGKGKVQKNTVKRLASKVLKKPHGAILAKKGKARFLKRRAATPSSRRMPRQSHMCKRTRRRSRSVGGV